jgi:hypothetical protein
MNKTNPYIRTRQAVINRLGAQNPNGQFAAQANSGASTALLAAMQKAKAYEQDAGAAATGDLMAQIRNAGKGESIKRDIDEDQAIQEFKLYTLKSMLKMQAAWTV